MSFFQWDEPYDLSDPKHSRFRELQAERADIDRKRLKEHPVAQSAESADVRADAGATLEGEAA